MEDGRVERPEVPEPGAVEQGRYEERPGERVGVDGRVRQEPGDERLALVGPDGRRVLRPVEDVLVVGGDRGRCEDGPTIGRQVDGGVVAAGVDERQVVGQLEGQPFDAPAGLGDVVAGLEQVAHDERDGEAVALRLPATERQADGQAGLVHAVEQAPEQIAGADDAAPVPGRPPDEALQVRGEVVVVAHEKGSITKPDRLRAGPDERRRVDQRQHPRRQVAAARKIDQGLVCGHELRHVLAQDADALGVARPRGFAIGEEPAPIGVPTLVERRLPDRAGLGLSQSVECHGDPPHARQRSGWRPSVIGRPPRDPDRRQPADGASSPTAFPERP